MLIEAPSDLNGLKQRFDSDGFVRVEQLLNDQALRQLDDELARYLQEIAPHVPSTDIVYEADKLPDGGRAVRNLWRMEEHSAFFGDLARTLGLAWIGPL